jgi:hypothetical protein
MDGAPTRLTDDTQRTLLDCLRLGNPFKTAAMFAGVDVDTINQWRRKGLTALRKAASERSANERRYANFVGALERAMTEASVRAQTQIYSIMTIPLVENGLRASPEQQRVILRAAEFHLSHRDPENYSTQTRTELSGLQEVDEIDAEALEMSEQIQAIVRAVELESTRDELLDSVAHHEAEAARLRDLAATRP